MSSTDTGLLKQWQARRDADAFAELVHRYSTVVFATCKRMLGDSAQAEDAAQECFIELMQSGATIRVSIGAWLHTIAVRRCIDRIKGDVRRRKRESVFTDNQAQATDTPNAAEVTELLGHVDEAIEELPDRLRAAIIGRFLEGQAHTVLARDLGVGESAIRYRVDQGIGRIRKSLKRKGIVIGTGAFAAALGTSAEAAPPALLARLGKLAMSGTLPAAGGALITAALAAKVALVAFLVAAAGTGLWAVQRTWHSEEASQNTTAQANSHNPLDSSTSDMGSTGGSTPSSTSGPATGGAAVLAQKDAGGAEKALSPDDVSISGRIYDKATGTGIAGIRVGVFPEGGGRYLGHSEPTKADGRYQLPRIEEDGTYSVSLRSIPAYPDPRRVAVTLKDGQPATDVDFALTKGLMVTGQVVDARGLGVASAEVGTTSQTVVNPIRTKTDTLGTFTLCLPKPTDSLMVQARNSEFESLPQPDMTLTEAGLSGLVLRLDQPRAASISGTVVDGTGRPMNKAKISLRHKAQRVFTLSTSGETNKVGAFAIEGLIGDEYTVYVYRAEAQTRSTSGEYARITLQQGEARTGLDIVYGERGGLAIVGRVVDSSGKPVGGASIRCYAVAGAKDHSHKDGSFRITGLEEGSCALNVEHHDYSRTDISLAAGTEDATIVLKGQGRLEGRVVHADTGAPLTSFNQGMTYGGIHDIASAPVNWSKTIESPDGTFEIGKLSAGALVIAVSAPGFGLSYQNTTIVENTATHLEFRLKPVPPFEGYVVNEQGTAVPDAFVYFSKCWSVGALERSAAARTDGAGKFVMHSLSPDVKRLGAYHPDYGIALLDLPGGNRIVLSAPGALEGVVSGQGISAADIVVNINHPDARGLIPSSRVKPKNDGTFILRKLTPGRVRVSAMPSSGGYPRKTASETVFVESGQTKQVTLRLEVGTAVVEGVLLADGQPVAKAWVAIEHRDGDRVQSQGMPTKADGGFRFEQVRAGSLVLKVSRHDPTRPQDPVIEEMGLVVNEGDVLRQEIEVAPLP
jgi:RNA polymerase sigma factor (sigma-70 family)